MTTAAFAEWLKGWLARHPLKAPSKALQDSYAQEVMRRIQTTQPSAPLLVWRLRPRAVFALGTAVACALAVVVVQRSPTRLAKRIEQDVQLLAQLGEGDELSTGTLEEELADLARLVLAEATPQADDEAWIEQTLELLDAVDEESPEFSDDPADNEWLRELEWLDAAAMASS